MSTDRHSRPFCRNALSAMQLGLASALGGLLSVTVMPLASAQAQTVSAEPDAASTLLIEQGNYWQSHQRGDLATQSWQKLLALNPNSPDGLYGMGIVEADRGRNAQAMGYLVKLRQVAPNFAGISTLAGRLGQPTPQNTELNAARQLAQAGQNAKAVERYKEAASGKAMTPEVALEYYQTLGGTADGWAAATQGLQKLAHDNPNNPRIALALAQQLTYRESSRREGIRQLAPLAQRTDSSDGTVAAAAKASWRQALIWLGARASDTSLYQAYLQVVPDDAAVKARLDAMAQQDATSRASAATTAAANAQGRAVAAGFAALQKGDLNTATARFTGVLGDHPNDFDALGGMGILRLRQEKFADAQQYLERASRGPNPGRWRSALNSATYWTLVNSATTARQAGDVTRARDLLERAIRIDPNEITAQNALGDTLLAAGNPQAAERAYRLALRQQANNPDAIRGVVNALTQQGRGTEALQFASQLNAQQQQRIGGLGTLRAQQQQTEARAAEQRGDLATARADLENALLNDPDSPWIRLDLARVYSKLGALTSARSVMDGLLASNPDMPDALYASALLYGEQSDWHHVLQLLARVPAQNRTADMATLQRRAWVHASVDQANALSANGQLAQAHALLEQVQPVAGNSPELIGVVASAFAQTKDDSRAIGLMRQLMALTSQPDAGLRIQYAGILLRTQQDAELAGVLRQVQAMQLTDAQRADFDRLQTALAIRQADNLRLRGDLPNAYEAIAPALAAHPDDPDLQSALARMYAATGEYNEALRLYIAAHQKRPDDLDLTLAAAGTASQAQNYSFAEDAIQSALKQAPNNAQVLAAAGRIYRADGKNGQAVTYLRKALAAENASTDGAGTSAGMSGASPQWAVPSTAQYVPGRPAANPFIGRTVIQPGAASAATSGEGLFFSGTRGEAASGAPTAGQFSGTGGPGSAPTMQPPAATSVQQGSYPYPTQAYPGQSAGQATGQPYYRPAVQPSPSQNMPYLPPNAPSQYLQQAPMPLPATRSAILRPSARNDAPASRVLARLGKPSADPTASEGADYDGASASGGGYAQQQQQPVYAPQQYQQANGYQQQQQQPVYAPQQYQQANGYQQQQQQPVYAPQQYQQANGYQQQQQQPVYAPQQYQQANGYQQQQQPVYAPQQYQQANGYQQQQQSVYAPQQYQQANGYQQQQQPVYAPQQYQQANAYQQQQQPVYAPRQYQQANGYQQQQQPVYQQQLPAYPQQPYAQQNGYRQAAPPPAQLPAPWPQDPAYAPTPTRIVAAVAPIPTDCDSIGADGGTRSAAGGSAAAQREIEECHAVKARKAPTRRIAASRLAPQRAPVYAQQQTYAPAYAQQPPLPQYQQPYQPQYAQQVAPQPMQQQVQQPVQQNVPAPMWNNGPGALAAAGPLSVQQELDQINQETTSTVSGGVSIHNRSGEQGLSALTDIEAPLEGRVRAGNGHIVVRVTPVTLDSGTADGRYDVSSRFGSGPAAATGSTAINAQNAQGVGLSAGYETNHYRLDVGTTPIGFKEQNVVGGLNYSGAISDKLTVTLEGSRRAVTDSLLSYAGVSDNRPGQSHTGQSWGGVTADTGRVGLTYDDGTNGLYGYGSYGYLSGDHVASNTRGEGGGGIYTRLLKDPDRELMAGVNVDVFGYNKNLSYFTYGQGGYFSPQQYISLSVPVSWSVRTGRFSYQVKGALGIQHFREDDSPYFPTDANMQAAAVTAAAGSTTQTNPVYAGQSKTGLGYNFQVAGEYQLGPQIFAGATAGIDNARDYSQWFGGLYVRYAFEKMTGSMAMPPKPLHSPYLAN